MKEKYFNTYNNAYKYCMVVYNKDNVTISYDNGKYYVGIDPAIDWDYETNLERKSRERNERINLILGE